MDKYFEYSADKNSMLKQERGICFEEIIAAINDGYLLDIIEHPNENKFTHQKIYVVNIDSYVYLVPFVKSKNGVFLKTIFPSRKFTKKYLTDDINKQRG